LAFVESRKLFGGRDMKKYSWIVALLLALSVSALFISCGAAFDATKLDPKPWVIDAKDIKLTKTGGNPGTDVDGNKFINKAGGGATSVGFYWTVPTGPNEDGFVWTDFEKVRVTIKILELKQPAGGVSYNAKSAENITTDVNRFGETKLYANAVIALAEDGEGFADYPVSGFSASGQIAFQYNVWEEKAEILGVGGREVPNHTIEVGFTFFTNMGEPPFVPVTGIEFTTAKEWLAFQDIALTAKVTPETATNTDVVWSIFPKITFDADGKPLTGVVDPNKDTKLKAGRSAPFKFPDDYDNISDDFWSKTTVANDRVDWTPFKSTQVTDYVDDYKWPWVEKKSDVTDKQGRRGKLPNVLNAKATIFEFDDNLKEINQIVHVVAVVKNGKAIGEDFVADFVVEIKPNPFALVELADNKGRALAPALGLESPAGINDMFGGVTDTNKPKYVVIMVESSSGFKLEDTFEFGHNAGSPMGQQLWKTNPVSVASSDADGRVYFVYDLSTMAHDYTPLNFGGYWQLCSWNGLGQLGLYKVFVIDPSVTSLIKPAGSTDLTGTAAGHGYLAPALPLPLTFAP